MSTSGNNLSVKLNMSETFPGCWETCRKRWQALAETSANVRKNIGKRSEKHRKTRKNIGKHMENLKKGPNRSQAPSRRLGP